MDEEESLLKSGDALGNDKRVYRIALISSRDSKIKSARVPAHRNFSLSPADQGKLSVDYEPLTTPEKCLATKCAEYKTGKTEFKEPDDREIYAMNISFLCGLESIDDVVYAPVFVAPPQKGKPNNPAHSLVLFRDLKPEDDPEVFVKIRDHAKDNPVPVDRDKLKELIDLYRVQWD